MQSGIELQNIAIRLDYIRAISYHPSRDGSTNIILKRRILITIKQKHLLIYIHNQREASEQLFQLCQNKIKSRAANKIDN